MEGISQKEYLKKYLSGNKDKKKKKRKNKNDASQRVKIIDDDIDLSQISSADAEDLFNTNEDAPQIVGVVDDRPMHMRVNDYRQSDVWRPLGAATTTEDTEEEFTGSTFQKEKEFLLKLIKKDSGKGFKSISLNKLQKSKNKKDEVTRWDLSRRERSNSKESDRGTECGDGLNERKVDNTNSNTTDSSPPRRKRRDSNDSQLTVSTDVKPKDLDISPPRRSRKFSDSSPPRKPKDGDISPPRRNRKDSRHQSEKSSSRKDSSPKRKLLPGDKKGKYLIPAKRMAKTLDGKTAGLQNAQELVQENEAFRKREDDLFKNMSTEVSGVNAATVLRDRRTGKVRDFQKEEEARLEKQKQEEANKEKYTRWGRGLKQVEDYENKLNQDLQEMNKPLARYADDEDLERYLMEQDRDGDPMLDYIRKKRRKKDAEMGKQVKPKFEGEFNPNRFGIRPGHRWDGVDRSNGYEKKWVEVQNAKNAIMEEVYKWSTEDM